MRIIGIDVARWQGTVNWDKVVESGVQWAWIKCTHGLGSADPQFLNNWSNSKGKLPRGVYHWFTDSDPMLQAQNILTTLEKTGDIGECPIAIDFEEPGTKFRGQELLDRLRLCLSKVEELSGRAPVLYTGTWYWQQYALNLDAQDLVENYYLWLAQYPRVMLADKTICAQKPPVLPKPSAPKPWASRNVMPAAWQFDGDGGCVLPNGVDADFNEYLADNFDEFCGKVDKKTSPINLIPPAFNQQPVESFILESFLQSLAENK